jgi:hypothetical protein
VDLSASAASLFSATNESGVRREGNRNFVDRADSFLGLIVLASQNSSSKSSTTTTDQFRCKDPSAFANGRLIWETEREREREREREGGRERERELNDGQYKQPPRNLVTRYGQAIAKRGSLISPLLIYMTNKPTRGERIGLILTRQRSG